MDSWFGSDVVNALATASSLISMGIGFYQLQKDDARAAVRCFVVAFIIFAFLLAHLHGTPKDGDKKQIVSESPAPSPAPEWRDSPTPAPSTRSPTPVPPTPVLPTPVLSTPISPTPVSPALSPTPAPSAPVMDSQELVGIKEEADQMSISARAIDEGLSHIRAQQASAGLGLRRDIAERQDSLRENLAKLADAAARNDTVEARRLILKARWDIDVLERFLGR